MPTELKGGALTTIKRVKDRLTITNADHDTVLERLINAASDFVEGYLNRVLKRATYTNEIYSVYAPRQEMFGLKQIPVITLTSAQYRAGTPSTPNWTSFIADEYELVGDGKSGIVKIYGGVNQGVNVVRFSYTAGYLLDFDNTTDTTKHTLPFDLSELVERLVVRTFKRRDSEGKTSEGFEGAQVQWGNIVTEEDKEILNRHRRVPTFV